jgi:hypothetical protein
MHHVGRMTVFVAIDSNATRYLIGASGSTMKRLSAAKDAPLDVERIWKIGVNVVEPSVPLL